MAKEEIPERCEMCHEPLEGKGRLVINVDVGNAWVCVKPGNGCASRHASRMKAKK